MEFNLYLAKTLIRSSRYTGRTFYLGQIGHFGVMALEFAKVD